MTKQEYLQGLFHRFQREHGGVPETPYTVVQWALRNGLLDEPQIDPAAYLADQMSRALREERAVDQATGREYRRNHAARITRHGVQGTLWAEMRSAPHDHMVRSFQQRRRQIVGDCAYLKADVDVYNSRQDDDRQIPLVLDFTDDVFEFEAASAEDDAAQ